MHAIKTQIFAEVVSIQNGSCMLSDYKCFCQPTSLQLLFDPLQKQVRTFVYCSCDGITAAQHNMFVQMLVACIYGERMIFIKHCKTQ
jgi:hypothetical protein